MKNLGAEHENLDQKAYQILKNMIVERRLSPGEKIPQEKIAQDLGISRTPLLGALKYLEQEKLVEAKPRRGFFVRIFTRQEMIDIFELREVLEGLAARQASKCISETQVEKLNGFFKQFDLTGNITDIKAYSREDRRFHNFIVEVSGKEFLNSILDNYNIISHSYQLVASEGLVRPPKETVQEHLAIIKAIGERDPDNAEKFMRLHFSKTIATLKEDLAEGKWRRTGSDDY